MRNCFALLLLVGVCHALPQTVYLTNQSPSHLYINTANGKAQVLTEGFNGTSDIIQLVLYPTDAQSNSPQEATVLIQGKASGFLKLLQTNPPVGETQITGIIHGLTPGLHGFHVHQTGNLSQGCLSTGAHYNPFQRDHGAPESHGRHVGDLGNIQADNAGNAIVNIQDRLITLVGPNSVLGRAIVVHDGVDDLGLGGDHGSRTTGNAGGRAGCGIIGRA